MCYRVLAYSGPQKAWTQNGIRTRTHNTIISLKGRIRSQDDMTLECITCVCVRETW